MKFVAPLAGAWIEIPPGGHFNRATGSLPLRERGLKLTGMLQGISAGMSLPLRERGLKFLHCCADIMPILVAPLAGAWIEIAKDVYEGKEEMSLPLRERGLKSVRRKDNGRRKGRSPCGSVD